MTELLSRALLVTKLAEIARVAVLIRTAMSKRDDMIDGDCDLYAVTSLAVLA